MLALAYLAFVCLVWTLGIPGGFQTLIINTLASGAIALGTALALSALDRSPQFEAPLDRGPTDAPLVERRVLRYRSWLAVVERGLAVLLAALALLELWGLAFCAG